MAFKSKKSITVPVEETPAPVSQPEPVQAKRETGPEAYARIQAEAKRRQAEYDEYVLKMNRVDPEQLGSKSNVAPPPAPSVSYTGSGLTYRQAIEKGLISLNDMPFVSLDAPYNPPAAPRVITGTPEPKQAELPPVEPTVSRVTCEHCGQSVHATQPLHRLETGHTKHGLIVYSVEGMPSVLCIRDRIRAIQSGRVTAEQLKTLGSVSALI